MVYMKLKNSCQMSKENKLKRLKSKWVPTKNQMILTIYQNPKYRRNYRTKMKILIAKEKFKL